MLTLPNEIKIQRKSIIKQIDGINGTPANDSDNKGDFIVFIGSWSALILYKLLEFCVFSQFLFVLP